MIYQTLTITSLVSSFNKPDSTTSPGDSSTKTPLYPLFNIRKRFQIEDEMYYVSSINSLKADLLGSSFSSTSPAGNSKTYDLTGGLY